VMRARATKLATKVEEKRPRQKASLVRPLVANASLSVNLDSKMCSPVYPHQQSPVAIER
jgi:hypothetical protein